MADERIHIGIAADDAVQCHDVGFWQLRCELHEVPVYEADAITVTAARCLAPRGFDVLGRDVDMHRLARAGIEQQVMDRADAAADVDERTRRCSLPAPSKAAQLALSGLAPELTFNAFALAAAHHKDNNLPAIVRRHRLSRRNRGHGIHGIYGATRNVSSWR